MKDKTASLYIHIPFCVHRCAYCDFFSTVLQGTALYEPYLESLKRDITFFKSLYSIDAFDTVYIGGGTPSLVPLELMRRLCFFITSSQVQEVNEFTIEANPQDITREHLASWQEYGINRLSVGIQSLQDEVLQNEGRRGGRDESIRALHLISKEWEGEVSLDFIAGLKGQTCETLQRDLTFVSQFAPHHISLYELVLHDDENGSRNKNASDEAREKREKIWERGAEILVRSGYVQYEVSNFSYGGKFECEHNKAYWKMRDYVGVGAAATGNVKMLGKGSEQRHRAMRTCGVRDVALYMAQEKRKEAYEWEEVSERELLKDALLMGFRLVEGVDDEEFAECFGFSLFELIPKTINKWAKMGLFVYEEYSKGRQAKLTKEGMMLLDTFLCDAFEEMDAGHDGC